ncbi:MAG: hypothetical protein JWO38_61 [Gemmataceae bacterium]|nr:hypothetical protein [Gemmataceae bacterium]
MRTGLLATALAVLLAPAAAPAADPPIVYQTQPIGRLLDDTRATIALVGGEKAVDEFNDVIKRALGEKGFDGLDLNRPVVGYVDVPADPKDTVAVLALPVTGEKEFLDFCERWNEGKPKALKDGLYEVPALNPDLKAVMRVSDGYAYVATAARDPGRALDPKALVPVAKVYDPTDPSLMVGRVYFDRFPKELRDKAAEGLDQAKKALAEMKLPPDTSDVARKAFDQFAKLATRYLDLSKGAKEAALRVNLDPATGDVSAEATLTAVPGSPLDQMIAGMKPTVNKFGGLLTPDTATGFKTRLPLFTDEIRTAAGEGLEALRKQVANNNFVGPAKGLIDEILKGGIRTVKTGEVDVVAAVRGPAKDGTFTAVGAIAFEDPSGVEKEIKKLIEAQAPQPFQDAITWDAAKVNGVSIHTLDIAKAAGGSDRELRQLFGPTAVVAVAFAPKAVYAAVGPDAVAAVKAAMALKPAPSPVLDVVLNADRVAKMVGVFDPQAAAQVARAFGKEDKLISAVSLDVGGGKELRVKFGINVRLLPRAAVSGRSAPVPPPMRFKK